MTVNEKNAVLTAKLAEDFESSLSKSCRDDFAGVYIKDGKLHIILVDGADTAHYKALFNDDTV